jgi:hypothetical protein
MDTREQTVKDHAQILWDVACEDLKDPRRQKAFIEFCKQAGLLHLAAQRYAEAAKKHPELAAILDGYKRDVLAAAMSMIPAGEERKNGGFSLSRLKTTFIIFIGLVFFSMAILLIMKFREVTVQLQKISN